MKIVKGTDSNRFCIKIDDEGKYHIYDTHPHLPLGIGMWGVYNDDPEEVKFLNETFATSFDTLREAWERFKSVNGLE